MLERDFYEERRRKWRRSAFWRGFGIAVVLALIVAAVSFGSNFAAEGDHIARYEVSGVIFDDPERDDLLAELAERDNVRAVVLRVNSPGGSTVGSEALYAGIRAIAAEKPVVAVLGEVAASGGYVAAIAADHIIGRGNTLTGSIGVILEYPDFTGLMARLGVELETVRSSELKAEPSPFRPTSPEARARNALLVADSYAWFRDLVGERRGLEGEALAQVANGGVFTGRLALDRGLIDALGGEPEAAAWLESRDPRLDGLDLRDWAVERDEPLLGRLIGKIGTTSGILEGISRWTGPKLYSIAPQILPH